MRGRTHLLPPLAALALIAAAAPPAAVMKGPDDGGWDYARVDPATSRLYVARATSVTAFDLSHGGPPRSIGSISHGHAVLPIPGTRDVLVTSGGDDSVRVLDADDGTQLARIPVGSDPDAAAIDPSTGRAYVMNAKDGTVSVLDLAKRTVVATVRLKPGLEFGALGKGILFVNNEDANEIETLDTRRLSAGPSIALPGCDGPSGLAYDDRTDRLLSACANGKAAVVDPAGGRLVGLLDIGRGPDAVILDAARRRAYVPCGATADLAVIDLDGAGGPSVVKRVPTEALARTGALDPRDGSVYLPTARLAPPPPGARRGPPVPGTFHVLVVPKPA
jgi:YVTN family beta-propeller protein